MPHAVSPALVAFKRAGKGVCHLALLALLLLAFPALALWSRLRLARLARRGAKPRPVFGPVPIINAITLAEAMRRSGYPAETVSYHPYYITGRFDWRFDRFRDAPILHVFLPYAVFGWALLRFDIFHFFYDGGFLRETPWRHLELPLLRLAGKGAIIAAYGGDVRTQETCRAEGPVNICRACPRPGHFCVCDERRGRANFAHHRRFASACLSMGDMLPFTPGADGSFFYWPIDVRAITPAFGGLGDGRVRIVHASNHRYVKGTNIAARIIGELAAEGLPVEFVVVENKPNDEARRIYATADIIFDQCLAGWHGYFAVEGLALGKPVVTFLRRREWLPVNVEPPFVNASPATLKERLRELVVDEPRRLAIGRASRRFAELVYSYEAVAARYDRLYRRLFPRIR